MFDAYYYEHGCGSAYGRGPAWLAAFNNFADHIIRDIQPQTVLDAGCAMGLLVEVLRQRGVEAWGVDISEYAIQNVAPQVKPYCRVGSVTEPFERRYDLIVSMEVVEHMQPADSEATIANLCQHSDDILFSSTPFDYREATHFNVQPPEVWAEMFARQNFYRDVDFDASFITPWAVRFQRRTDPPQRLVRDYERKYWLLWKENTDLRSLNLELRNTLSANDQSLTQAKERAATLETELETKQRRVAELQDQLTGLLNSRSWRWAQGLSRLGLGKLLGLWRKD